MAARLATVSRTRARGRDRCLGPQQAGWDSIPTKSCGEDFLSSSLPDLTITGLDTGEILGAFHSYVDQTIISIIEDSSLAESKCPLDEESEATLLTALTEILDTVDDENPSPFDTLPDNELFASPKGVHEGQLRAERCSWASFPDSEKDLFKCVDTPVPQDVSWSSEKTANEDCFGLESLSDHTGDTISDVAGVSKPAIEILDLQLDSQLDSVGFEDSVTLVFDQISPCVINVEHVSLSDLVKYVHPYCLPSEDSTDPPTKAVNLDVELVQDAGLLDLEGPATVCESAQCPYGTSLTMAGERPVAAGDPPPDGLPHSPLGQTVVSVTSPVQEQPPAPVRKRGRPRKVSKPEERAAVGMQRGRAEGPVTRSSLRLQLQPEAQDLAQPVETKGPQTRLRARGRRNLGAELGSSLRGSNRQQGSRTADAEEIGQHHSPSLQEVLTEDGAKGIEAADLMSLLEQFEVNEVNDRPSPPVDTRVAETDGKIFLDQVFGVELVDTAGLTPPAMPPYQHWKSVSPAGRQHQGGAKPLQSSPPQTLRSTEAKQLVQNKGSKCVEDRNLTGTSATHVETHLMTTATVVGTQSVTSTSTTYVGTESMTGSLTTYVGTQSVTGASAAHEDTQPITRASVTQRDVQSGTKTLTTHGRTQTNSLSTHVGVQSMSRTVSTPALGFGDHEYCLPSVPTGHNLPHKTIPPPGMKANVACRWNVKRQSSITIKPITLLNHRASKVLSGLQKQGDGSSCAVQGMPRDEIPSAGAGEGSRTLESGSIGPEGEIWTPSPSETEECKGEPSGSERDCNRTQSSPCYRRQYSSSSSSRSRSRSHSQSRSWSRSPARKRRRYYRRRSRHSRHSSRSDSRSSSRSRSFSRSNSRSTSGSRSRSRSPQRCSVQMSYFTDEFDPYDVGPRQRYHYSRRQAHEHKINRRRELAIEERRVVYVGKIRNGMMREELRRRFEVFGEIEDCNIYFRTQGDNYGFVTYRYTCDAFAAIENGQSLRRPDELPFDLCFGGRRQFCKTNYADLDSSHSDVGSYSSKSKFDSVDFDTLLKQAKRSLQR